MSGVYAIVGRLVVWGILAIAATYGAVGLYIFAQLFFTYCRCDLINSISF